MYDIAIAPRVPQPPFRALLVCSGPDARRALRRCLAAAFPLATIEEAGSGRAAHDLLCRGDYALVVADEANAEVLDAAARQHPWTARVLVGERPDGRGPHAVLPRDAPLPEAAAALRRAAGGSG